MSEERRDYEFGERRPEEEYEARPRPEVVTRLRRPETVSRLRRSLRGAVAALRRWERYYERRYAETRLRVFRERLERVRRRLETLLRFREALERSGWDLFALAASETWLAIIRGDNRVYIPDDLPPSLRDAYRDAVRVVLEHHTQFGYMRTGWDGLVDCDGTIIDALRTARPSDRAVFYAYVRLTDEITYRYGNRVKITDTLTVTLRAARLSDVDVNRLFADALREARILAEENGARIETVCIVAKPAL